MDIKEKIKSLEALGITRYQISKDLDFNQNSLSNWYHGKTKPNKQLLKIFNSYYESMVKK